MKRHNSDFTERQRQLAEHIAEGFRLQGIDAREAELRAWTMVRETYPDAEAQRASQRRTSATARHRRAAARRRRARGGPRKLTNQAGM